MFVRVSICLLILFLVSWPGKVNATTIVDVMILFDNTAKNYVNSFSNINLVAQQAVDKLNQAMQNSNINLRFNLVHTQVIDFTFNPGFSVEFALSTTLEDMRYGSGSLGIVKNLRDRYGADLVSLFVDVGSDFGTVGVGYVLQSRYGDPDSAYNVCNVRSVLSGHTYTHEIGHNFGCHHSKYQAVDPGPNYALNTYSAGWYFKGDDGVDYHTIMAYSFDGIRRYVEAPLFSSPLVKYKGVQAGHPQHGDNARTIRETMGYVSNYRKSAQVQTCSLSVVFSGTGSGSMYSDPQGLNCRTNCTAKFPCGTTITLTQVPDSGSRLLSWDGACKYAGNANSCAITLSSDTTVTVIYEKITLPTQRDIKDIISCDLDGDALSDLVVLTQQGDVLFTKDLKTWNRVSTNSIKTVACRRINSDFRSDLAIVKMDGTVFYSTDEGRTWKQVSGALEKIFISDIDGDGLGDLVGINDRGEIYASTYLAYFVKIPGALQDIILTDMITNIQGDELIGLNSKGEIFYTVDFRTWGQIPGILKKLTARDLNRDGSIDIIGINHHNEIYMANNFLSFFYGYSPIQWRRINGLLVDLITGDFDGDGLGDVVGINDRNEVYFTKDLMNWQRLHIHLVKIIRARLNSDSIDDLVGVTPDNKIFYSVDLKNFYPININ